MFVFPVATFLAEVERLKPDLLAACRRSVDKASQDLDFVRLDREAFAQAESISVDYAVMEQTEKATVVPLDIGWNDVGSWSALWDISAHDGDGNVFLGEAIAA